MTNKARRSVGLPAEEIERTVELLQTSKVGNLDGEDVERFGQDKHVMFGGASGPIAKINTTCSSGSELSNCGKVAKKYCPWDKRASVTSPPSANSAAGIATTQRASKKFAALRSKPRDNLESHVEEPSS